MKCECSLVDDCELVGIVGFRKTFAFEETDRSARGRYTLENRMHSTVTRRRGQRTGWNDDTRKSEEFQRRAKNQAQHQGPQAPSARRERDFALGETLVDQLSSSEGSRSMARPIGRARLAAPDRSHFHYTNSFCGFLTGLRSVTS